ncbi:MAG: hypothetical protein FIB00_11970 [Chloroflexi bacterium]|nr:hypothetical protein [Chloroflexota bacterium]
MGAAEMDERADGGTEVDFGGAYDLSVKGVNDGGNSAVVPGDSIYYVDADTPKLSKKVTGGTFYGFAMEAVDAGATATITVATR